MYPTASAPQYAFGPGLAPVSMPTYKKGGDVKQTYGLENAAEMIRQLGREDDTILAHINPQEAGILKLLGGSGTTNPYTGLPEFKFLPGIKKIPIVGKPLYQAGSQVGKAIESGVESIAKALGPVGQIAAAYFGGPIGAALYAGLAPPGSGFDTKAALKAGALTYAAGQLQGPGGAPTGGETGAFDMSGAADLGGTGSFDMGGAGYDYTSAAAAPSVSEAVVSAPTVPTAPGGAMDVGGAGYNYGAGAPVTELSIDSTAGLPASPSLSEGLGSLGEAVGERVINYAVENPLQAAGIGYGGYTAYKTKQELDAARDEANRILADQANRKQEEINWARGIMDTYAPTYARLTEEDIKRERGLLAVGGRIDSYDDELGSDDGMMQGGIAALAKGGLPPRYLSGGGDGMSDSIKANIDGKQEARLADGEFVVPADVVSHIGNGSSNAGAKKLYAMMDRVRKSRTGKTSQAPEVNTRRLMPA